MGLASDYIDLLSSGDREKIGCVLLASSVAAGASGVAAGVFFAPANVVPVAGTAFNATAAGIGAVFGALLAAKVAYNVCGGEETRGSFESIMSDGTVKVNKNALNDFEKDLMKDFSVSSNEARKLSKLAYVYSLTNTSSNTIATYNEKKYSIDLMLEKLDKQGVV